MANITRFSPFRSLERFSPLEDMERMLEGLWRRPLVVGGMQGLGDIRIDVSEDANRYTVRADMPGLLKDDIRISIDGNQVSIMAEIKQQESESGSNVLCCERYYGQQYRSFSLNSQVDESKAEAKYENGVLELILPKKAGAASHEVKVH